MLLDEEAGFLCKFGQVSCANFLYSVYTGWTRIVLLDNWSQYSIGIFM